MNGMVWVRVLVGAVWLNGGLEKLLNPSFPRQFATSLQAGGFISQAPPFFQDFMRNMVVPNAEIVAQLMRAGELTLGIVLILGLLTNLAALGSIGLSAVIMLSQGGVRLGLGLGPPVEAHGGARIEHPPNGFAQHIDRQHGHHQGDARGEHQVRRAREELDPVLDHGAPGRGALDTRAQDTQDRRVRAGDASRRLPLGADRGRGGRRGHARRR